LYQLRRQLGELLVADIEASWKHLKVFIFDKAIKLQLIEKRSDRRPISGDWDEKTNSISVTRALRTRRERPRRHAAESRDGAVLVD
jgi:hypothetical protein